MKAIIATGASGGHLFPAIEVAKELHKKEWEILFVGTFGVGKHKIDEAGFSFEALNARGFQSQTWINKILALCSYIRTTIQSIGIIRKNRPQVVVGFGGYGAFPVVLAAALLRVPTMIHEQNVLPGGANKCLKGLVTRIAISFKESIEYFPRNKTVLTGCPVKKFEGIRDKEGELTKLGLSGDRKTILIFGGSQGSKRINEETMRVIEDLSHDNGFQVIHVTGRSDNQVITSAYKKLNLPFKVYEFCDDMNLVYGVSDIVIARAGASTVLELIANRKRAVLIPYPYANHHQYYNALVLKEIGLAAVIEEEKLTPSVLKEAVLSGVNQPCTVVRDEELEKIYFSNASQLLAQEAIKLNQ